MRFEGIYTPVVTPYHDDFSLNENALADVVELLFGRIGILSKLDFRDGHQAGSGQANTAADNAFFGQAGVEDLGFTMFFLQAQGHGVNPAFGADVFAEDQHFFVVRQLKIKGFTDRGDHVDAARFGNDLL